MSGVIAKWWWTDYRAACNGREPVQPFPGATPVSRQALVVAALGSIILLAAETIGETALKITAQQSHLTGLFAVYTISAAFVEELIFRGYVVITNRGRSRLILGIVGASLLFALLHPYLWSWQDDSLTIRANEPKAWFSTGMIFIGSLWFYTVRFMPLNRNQSLLPCIVAHATKNIGVIAIKYSQGFISGWW